VNFQCEIDTHAMRCPMCAWNLEPVKNGTVMLDASRRREQFKGHGGEGGILLPPFMRTLDDSYTCAIIACI
jgi:hypothetical protein